VKKAVINEGAGVRCQVLGQWGRRSAEAVMKERGKKQDRRKSAGR
jgi:hypothetical protein